MLLLGRSGVAVPVQARSSIPSYVLEYGTDSILSFSILLLSFPTICNLFLTNIIVAPLVWLHSTDPYRPSDIGQQLVHTVPKANEADISGAPSPLTLDNLDSLNALGNTTVFLTSKERINADPQPDWFKGVTPNAQGKTEGAVSSAIITYDHGDGTLDAFYFHFYA